MGYTDESFFKKLKPYVIADMKQTGILASLTAAQAYIESKHGNSGLTTSCNNLFGIKGEYKGRGEMFWTTEYYNGVATRVRAKFRKYPSWLESINDHSALFNRLARYKNLRGETNYIKACQNVKADGYATGPTYDTTLINTINKFRLYEWDAEVLGSGYKKPSSVIKPKPVLKKGSRGDYVLAWQKYLNQAGYPCGLEDGKFGNNTETAVKEFQKAHGLMPDGIIGPKTWEVLN